MTKSVFSVLSISWLSYCKSGTLRVSSYWQAKAFDYFCWVVERKSCKSRIKLVKFLATLFSAFILYFRFLNCWKLHIFSVLTEVNYCLVLTSETTVYIPSVFKHCRSTLQISTDPFCCRGAVTTTLWIQSPPSTSEQKYIHFTGQAETGSTVLAQRKCVCCCI